MKKLSQLFAVAGVASALLLSVGAVNGQDNNSDRNRDRSRGNFDPSEMRQRMMENIRDQMKVTDDKEWKILEERINKVMDARRDVGFGGGSRLFRRPGGDSNNGGSSDRRRGFGSFGGEPSAEQQALDKAIDSNASKDALKDAMAKARAAKKAKEDKLAAAQEELKKVLSTQQEAVALSMGLVN